MSISYEVFTCQSPFICLVTHTVPGAALACMAAKIISIFRGNLTIAKASFFLFKTIQSIIIAQDVSSGLCLLVLLLENKLENIIMNLMG